VSVLPIGLRADTLTVLVAGGGSVAARKARAFLDAGARVRVVAPVVDEALAGADDPLLQIFRREFSDADLDNADIAVAATNDAAVNARVARLCRERRLLCNRADEPADGTFDMLAVHRAGSLAIGVSAGGAPAAAALIRDALATRFDVRYGDALERLGALRSSMHGSSEWAEASAQLAARDFCESVESGTFLERLAQWD
jgi:siroheme synthase-like protein